MIVTIDGPAAAGKGTLARRLAAALGYVYLDTGALYRAVAKSVLEAGGDPDAAAEAAAHAKALDPAALEDPGLRGEEVGDAASRVAALPAVRTALLGVPAAGGGNTAGGRAGRARYGHGHLPGRGTQAIRDGQHRGAHAPPSARVAVTR